MPDTDAAPRGALTLRTIDALAKVDRDAWDAVANPAEEPYNPFVAWDFLEALEQAGCVSLEAGWSPVHLLAEDADGALLGAVPLYLKWHSYGEFVFDHGWADAYERAGGQYYPKLLSAAPFSPATGPRMLSGDPRIRAAMQAALPAVAEQLGASTAHVIFPHQTEWELAGEQGFLQRADQQFQWTNQGYETFEDFTAALASRKRKALRKERATAHDGVRIERLTGDAITPDVWDAFYAFYQDTGARKWGAPYLNREFFELLDARMRDRVLMVMVEREDRFIAGALNLIGGDTLYGRYWGRVEERPCLHFEVCYYQAIEEAIARGLARVEAGAQGAHKMARGYSPTPVYSYHWIADPGFRAAVADFLERERAAVDHEIRALTEMTPFKKG